jgi:hypothetical protein
MPVFEIHRERIMAGLRSMVPMMRWAANSNAPKRGAEAEHLPAWSDSAYGRSGVQPILAAPRPAYRCEVGCCAARPPASQPETNMLYTVVLVLLVLWVLGLVTSFTAGGLLHLLLVVAVVVLVYQLITGRKSL